MAGFFGFFDYTKPGPGVPKDGPPKARILVFFEIFTRKFWNLIKLNIMFSVFNIPALIAAIFAIQFMFQNNLVPQNIAGMTKELALLNELFIRFMIAAIFMCIPVITVGPAQAGFTYVLRNYSREEHAFLWWDFKEAALKNLKQSLIVSFIDLVIIVIIGVDINVYTYISKGNNNILFTLASGFVILAFITYLIMHMYIYPMMVTFNLNIKQLYKNALIFSIMDFLPNLGILLLCVVIVGASFLIYPVIGIFLFPVITMSFIGLITNFYVYPRLKKHMIDKIENSNEIG